MSLVTSRIIGMGSALLLALGAFGCREEGPAERAGRAIDEAVEDVGDSVKDAGDKMEEAMDQEKEKMQH